MILAVICVLLAYRTTTLHCIISQKSTDYIYNMAEA
jgi:hypothetical protein